MATDNGKPLSGQDILSGTFEKDRYYNVIFYPRLNEEQKIELNDVVLNGSQEDINNYFGRIFQPLIDYCEAVKAESPRVLRHNTSIGIKTASFIIKGIRGDYARNIPFPKNYTIEKQIEN